MSDNQEVQIRDLQLAIDPEISAVRDIEISGVLTKVWPLIERGRQQVGFNQTSEEGYLSNLQLSGETPFKWYQQCHRQAEMRTENLQDMYFNYQKDKELVRQKRLEAEDGNQMAEIEANELEAAIVARDHHIRQTAKELQHYLQTAEKLRQEHNIPEQISEEQLLEYSKREHIRLAMKQSLRDMENHGVISPGVQEHLEHYGIHPSTAKKLVLDYLRSVEDLFKQDLVPTIKHMDAWIDRCEEILASCPDEALVRMKIKQPTPEN